MEKAIQRESMDDELRNGLSVNLWDKWDVSTGHQVIVGQVVSMIWSHYFKATLDRMPDFESDRPKSGYGVIRDYFFAAKWWEVFDFIEFILKNVPDSWKNALHLSINIALTEEKSAYRMIGDEIVEITDQNEISAVETAFEKSNRSIQSHLSTALALLSDRKSPDYRNSIKESISAVESACQIIAGKPNATLGDCISPIKKSGMMHPAFVQALTKLYGYPSDEGGIRHALTDESVVPSFADAKFMLVTSSAFVNFLWTKASEWGVRIEK